MNRREFLDRSKQASLGLAAGMTILADARSVRATPANEKLTLALVGAGGRGRAAGRRISRPRRLPHRLRLRREPGHRPAAGQGDRRAPGRQTAQGRAGLPQGARRQVGRRRGHRHARPLARPGHDLGLPGRQGRVRGEAAQPQLLGRPQDGRGRPQVQADRAGGHAEPQRAVQHGRQEVHRGRASWARSTSAACSIRRTGPTSPPCPTATRPQGFDWDMWNGPAPEAQVQRQLCRTTGTTSGATPAATSSTTASTRSTWPAGCWASSIPSRSTAPAGDSTQPGAAETPDTQVAVFDFDELRDDLRADALHALHAEDLAGHPRARHRVPLLAAVRHADRNLRQQGADDRRPARRRLAGVRPAEAARRRWSRPRTRADSPTRSTRRTSSSASARGKRPTPTSRKGTAARCWPTSPTSATAWAGRS